MYVGKLAQRQNSFKHVQGTYGPFHSHVCKIVSAFVRSNNMEDNYSGALKATASLQSNAFLCEPLWAERILMNPRAPVLVGGHSLCCAALVCPIVGFHFEYCPLAYLSGFIHFFPGSLEEILGRYRDGENGITGGLFVYSWCIVSIVEVRSHATFHTHKSTNVRY